MPWDIEKRGDEFCVIKRDTGESEGCHETREKAEAQLAALNIAEQEDKADKAQSLEQMQNEIVSAFNAQHPEPASDIAVPAQRFWVVETFVDRVIVHKGDAFWSVPFTRDLEGEIVFADDADWVEVEERREWIEKAEAMKAEAAAKLLPDEEKSHFFVYKSADGTRRWASISSVAIKDKEFEIVTEQAQDDAIQHARDTGEFGEIDLVHVDGTDVGKCDLMMRAGKQLIEGGTFDDTDLANGAIKAVEDDPDYWGVSIKFVFDPSKFDGEKYHGNIRIRKRTILPQEMAASFGTKFVAMKEVTDMQDEMSDKARAALEKLNVSEETIEALAEKKVETEPNTVEKADKPETVEVKKSVWERLKEAAQTLFAEPDADAGGEETEEVEDPEPAQKEAGVSQADMEEVFKALSVAISTPLIEQIKTLADNVAALELRVKESEQAVEDKFLLKLAEAPPVVTARVSQVKATEVEPEAPTGPVFPNAAALEADYATKLFEGVTQAVEAGIGKALADKVQV
jgi:hypothetical protein